MHVRDVCSIQLPRPRAADLRAARQAEPRDTYVPSDGEPPATREFWTWDFAVMPPGAKRVQATLRARGDGTELWVDDAAWGKTVTEEDVRVLSERLESRAPSGAVDPTKGVYANDVAYFGEPPHGIDASPRVAVLISEFAPFNGTTLDGYFNAFDQLPEDEAVEKYGQHSNERNLIYLNAASSRISGDYMQGVLAHELSHLLQFARDPEETAWLGETLGEVAMAVNGYHTDFGHVARHQRRPSSPLESDTYVDYGAAYLFGTYLLERYGKPFIADLARDPLGGRASIDATLQRAGAAERFEDVVADWAIANYADSRDAVAPGRHYGTLDVPPPAEAHVLDTATPRAEGKLAPTGAAYIRSAAAAKLAFSGDAPARVQVMDFRAGRLDVRAVDPAQPFDVPADAVVAVVATGDTPLQYALEAAAPPSASQAGR